MTDEQEQWRRVRGYLNENRYALTQQLLGADGELPLLTRPHWVPVQPVPLERVRLRWEADAPAAAIDGRDGVGSGLYSDAVRNLARPRLFENRVCYRLLEVAEGEPSLTFGRGRYFDVIDICEAVAHEYAAAVLAGKPGDTPFRDAIADPTDLARRPVMAAVTTLTIRHDRRTGEAEFLLHWRDPAKVATGGGLYQVMPCGMFQPSHDAPWNEGNDFDLWRAILRELNEELLGGSEDYGSGNSPIDYADWPLNEELSEAREDGRLRLFWLGLGMDPLTYVTDLLTVAVFDADLFDATFRLLVTTNDEGHRVALDDATGRSAGIPFTAAHVDRFTTAEPMQPAGAALLRLAWQHRDTLLPPESK
ncbi:hypothetical protein [Kitasatospora sp. NPDC101183]|uniref:hypothetical protein n=1 Tax=Kitasatospora sp. NPDC101183 TaxID=3364100 RepID=UPI003805E6C7